MLGTIIGAIIQTGEVGSAGLLWTFPDTTPPFLVWRGGTVIMVFFTLVFIFPLSMLRNMRGLELVGALSTGVIWFLMISVVTFACSNGLPALESGAFAPVNQGSVSDVASAFSLFGFAFYLQAIMMPMLSELPPGRTGARITNAASAITVLGVALVTYVLTGFFAAAQYGYGATSTDILSQQWFGHPGSDTGGAGQFALNFLMTCYLAVSLPPIVYTCCLPVNNWMVALTRGKFEELNFFKRRAINVTLVLGICLAVALASPDQSGPVLTVTGATGVCLVSYVIPIVSHFLMLFGQAHFQRQDLARSSSMSCPERTPSEGKENFLEADDLRAKLAQEGARRAALQDGMGGGAEGARRGVEGPGEMVDLMLPQLSTNDTISHKTSASANSSAPLQPIPFRSTGSVEKEASFPSEAQSGALTAASPRRRYAMGVFSPVRSSTLTGGSLTSIGYFRVHRVYQPRRWPRPVMIFVEVVVPLCVGSLGVLVSACTLATINQSE
ncbi:hypothetical protein H632_c124p0 [Helicosporidium sp. ATCC 50920]|nr:hypothetical protein H632_c124p0 [Helicosporidium sp. ATCC 50920]|eukprot:KDD76732.1 hypothetical protein H632_c124p0 [Helicosporidium sp. ATCC 50920]